MINEEIPSPNNILDHNIGENWTKYKDITSYMKELANKSPRVKFLKIGETWRNRDICLVIISDPTNLKNLETIKEISRKLADTRNLPDPESAISNGKAVVMTICGVHGLESSNVEMSMSLAYDLATSDDAETKRILKNVVFVLCPCINPDGHEKYVEWYSSVDSKYSPEKYYSYRDARGNHYGFDLNRQYVLASQPESKAILETINEWRPQVITDLHGAGWNMDVRFYFAPYGRIKTAYEDIDDKTIEWANFICGNIAKTYDTKGFSYKKETSKSISNPASMSVYAYYRGIIGILFECADPGTGISRPVPVPPLYGKKWTLSDMIDYHYTATRAVLSSVAENKEAILRDFHRVRASALEKGIKSPPYAFVIPPNQDNVNDLMDLIRALFAHGVEVNISEAPFVADGNCYPKGTYIVLMAQPERTIAKTLLEDEPNIIDKSEEPDHVGVGWVSDTGKRSTSWSLPIAMGVKVDEIKKPFNVDMRRVYELGHISGVVIDGRADFAYVINYVSNECVKAITRLLNKGFKVNWSKENFEAEGKSFAKGALIIPVAGQKYGIHEEIESMADELSLSVNSLKKEVTIDTYKLNLPKIAVYSGKGCHNFNTAHVGLIKFALVNYGFDFKEVDEKSIKTGELEHFDVLIIPDGYTDEIMMGYIYNSPYPSKDKEGLGEKGAKNLGEFIHNGGFIIGLGLSGELLTKDYLDITDVDFIGQGYSSGMVVKLLLDTNHPISYGYEEEIIAFYGHHPVYETSGSGSIVASYPDSDIVVCGNTYSVHLLFHHSHSEYLADPSVMAGKVAIMDAKVGNGHAILIGLDPLFRNYWRRTYRLFFNSILYSKIEDPDNFLK